MDDNIFQGFKVLSLVFSEKSKVSSQILWKPHIVRDFNKKKPSSRTLFIVNIPPYITKESLKFLMTKYGSVVNVFLHKKANSKEPPDVKYPLLNPELYPEGYKVAYVVYKDSSSIQKAMSAPSSEVLVASTEQCPIVTGIKKWQQEYNGGFVPIEDLQREIKRVMGDYDRRKEVEKNGATNDPDQDGWITVTSKRKKLEPPSTPYNPSSSKPRSRKKKKKMVLQNFYAFQRKEANLKHLEERRKKFEEDGRKMALMRSARKFRPL